MTSAANSMQRYGCPRPRTKLTLATRPFKLVFRQDVIRVPHTYPLCRCPRTMGRLSSTLSVRNLELLIETQLLLFHGLLIENASPKAWHDNKLKYMVLNLPPKDIKRSSNYVGKHCTLPPLRLEQHCAS